MNTVPSLLSVLALTFGLLLVQSATSVVIPIFPFTPNVVLPVLLVLSVSSDIRLTRGVVTAFALGYLQDLFCDGMLGLQTFLSVSTFLLARYTGFRLRGPAYQAGSVFFIAILVGAAALALRALFGPAAPLPGAGLEGAIWAVVPQAIATAVLAPLVIAAVGRVQGARKEVASF